MMADDQEEEELEKEMALDEEREEPPLASMEDDELPPSNPVAPPAPLPRATAANPLVWSLETAKQLFAEDRLWPSFIGAKRDEPFYGYGKHNQKVQGKLPVMLWREQQRLLADKAPGEVVAVPAAAVATADGAAAGSRKRKQSELSPSPPTSPSSSSSSSSASASASEPSEPPSKRARAPFSLEAATALVFRGVGAVQAALSSTLASLSRLVSFRPYAPDWDPARFRAVCRMAPNDYQYAIFKQCQAFGYFIGPGDVYGGDYNIYRGGDPSNSHSTATIRIIRRRSITARDLLSYSRVQNQVAKSAVLAYIDPDKATPAFLVVNFRNVSERL